MVEELINSIKSQYPNCEIELENFPSNNVIIDLTIQQKYVMVEYYQKQAVFGISLLDDNTLPFTPHDNFAKTVQEAMRIISSLATGNE